MAKLPALVNHSVSKRPISLVDAAFRIRPRVSTMVRIAGSSESRSASFTSSYPANRPNTDCRNNPSTMWRSFLPRRASVRIDPAMSVSPSA